MNQTNTNKYSMKSRSNITLLPNQAEHSSIVPQALASSKLGHGTNYEMQANSNFMQKRASNSGINNANEETKSSRFAGNYMAKDDGSGGAQTLPNIKLNSENFGPAG